MLRAAYRPLCLTFVTGFAAWTAVAQERADLSDICRTCRVEVFAECGGFLEGATFDRSGRLWAVDLLSGNILRVDENRQCRVEGNTSGQPNGAKFHRDGRLFIADKLRGILAFDPDDGSISVVADVYGAERIRGTNDLVFDTNGGLFFTEPYGSSALDPDGRVFYLPPGSEPLLDRSTGTNPGSRALIGNRNPEKPTHAHDPARKAHRQAKPPRRDRSDRNGTPSPTRRPDTIPGARHGGNAGRDSDR